MYTHDTLVKIAHRWLAQRCGFVFAELCACTSNGEIPDAIGFRSGGISLLIECKATRSDFLSDKSKRFRRDPSRGMGNFRWYLAPSGVIEREELPQGWGLIQVGKNGQARQVLGPSGNSFGSNNPFFHRKKSKMSENDLMYSALRRLYIRDLVQHIYERPPRR